MKRARSVPFVHIGLTQWSPNFLRSDPNLKKIKSERYRDPNYVQTVCKEIYFTNSVLQPLQKATQVKEFINNTNTRNPKANTK